VHDAFRWEVPEFYNIGVDVCDRWAEREPGRLALTFVDESGGAQDYSFGDLRDLSNQLANLLVS
jgi:acetyl-CoA synthetase